MEKEDEAELAILLANLRLEGRQQSGLDQRLAPPDNDTAYRIAKMVEVQLGWRVGGGKIAGIKPEMQRALRTDTPIYGRVFEQHIVPSPARFEFAELCSPFPEVEFQARLGMDLPPRDAPYHISEVTEAVETLHPGIELAECRFIYDEYFPSLPAVLADGAGSATLIYGPPIDNWKSVDIASQEVSLYCNGKLRRSGSANEALEHPMIPLTWLTNELSRTRIGLKTGQMISTGTMTGMLRPRAGQSYHADFGPLGTVSLKIN